MLISMFRLFEWTHLMKKVVFGKYYIKNLITLTFIINLVKVLRNGQTGQRCGNCQLDLMPRQ